MKNNDKAQATCPYLSIFGEHSTSRSQCENHLDSSTIRRKERANKTPEYAMTMNTVKRFTLLIILLTIIASPAIEAYYDPHVGRFTQRDPAGDGVNHYAYGANNPMKFVDPTGMYIVLPGGTEIRSVPDQIDGSYVMPGGLSSDSQAVRDSLFTGGKGTGIAGSNTARDMLATIINSPIRVEIKFDQSLPKATLGTAENVGELILVDINTDLRSSNPKRTMTLLHELSHAHDYMTMPSDYGNGNPYHASMFRS